MRMAMLATVFLASTNTVAAQETRFTPTMQPGDRLELENINGRIEVTQGRGRTAEIVVTKRVVSGNGALVKVVMEENGNSIRVCTIYLGGSREGSSCDRGYNVNNNGERLNVQTHYRVVVPAGVSVEAESVNGAVTMTGLTAPSSASTVNGDISFEGSTANSLETVNGSIDARFDSAEWDGGISFETVNGSIALSLPAGVNTRISGETLHGKIDSGPFDVTVLGKWGPRSFQGTIGSGSGGRSLNLETVNGSIELRQR